MKFFQKKVAHCRKIRNADILLIYKFWSTARLEPTYMYGTHSPRKETRDNLLVRDSVVCVFYKSTG